METTTRSSRPMPAVAPEDKTEQKGEEKPEAPALKVAEIPPEGRMITIEVWLRGKSDPLFVAFHDETKLSKTAKRTKKDWDELYKTWLGKPR